MRTRIYAKGDYVWFSVGVIKAGTGYPVLEERLGQVVGVKDEYRYVIKSGGLDYGVDAKDILSYEPSAGIYDELKSIQNELWEIKNMLRR